MRGSKPRAKVVPIRGANPVPHPPEWLTAGARREWQRAGADLGRRGILFEGALASLAIYCAMVDQVERLAAIVAEKGPIDPAQGVLLKTAAQARMLAAELGLSVVSRTRSFQGKSADEQAWQELEVG
jgi:phage terminase small subunit